MRRAATPPPPRTGVVLQTLTDEQREARARALNDARAREEEDRRRQEADAAVRREREAREKAEREAAEARKREEDLRRQQEANFKKPPRRRRAGASQAASRPRRLRRRNRENPSPRSRRRRPCRRAPRPQPAGDEAPVRREVKRVLTPVSPGKAMLPTPRPSRGAEPRQRGRLTVTTATSAEDERTRSVAAFRRRTQRLEGSRPGRQQGEDRARNRAA